jgi:hypothetical protein
MLLMFLLWIAVFVGVFLRWRWTPAMVIVSLAWTVILLKLHMTSAIPLNF